MRRFERLENLVQSAFDRTTRRYRRAMSEDTESHFEATRTLRHQERDLGGASFVGRDVSDSVPDKSNVEESKQTKQSREEMREEGQSGEGKSNDG
jgi:hypothetical protein